MTITKFYDEMTDRYQYTGNWLEMRNSKDVIGQVWFSVGFVDGKDGGDTFWLMVRRKGDDWYWDSNPDFILLVDGERFTGVGGVTSTEVTEEAGFFDSKIFCNEEIHCGGDVSIMNLLAKSSSAKFRLGAVDFILPPVIIADIQEIVSEIASNGGYGK